METRRYHPEHLSQPAETHDTAREQLESERNRLAMLKTYRQTLEIAPTTNQ
ncbi:MAG: hypothetical protein WCT27_02035 [Patescibacteria group bacterium]